MGNLRRGNGVGGGFSTVEIEQLNKMLTEKKEDLLDEDFCRKLAETFNVAPDRVGRPAVHTKQLQAWFRSKLRNQASRSSTPVVSEEMVQDALQVKDLASNENHLDVSLPVVSNPDLRDKIPEDSDLEFEARSSFDGAWYDVSTFLAYRFTGSGELEVRVRFEGFGPEEDEWVNVVKAIRVRSIPLESTDCTKVAVGDLVLCYRENNNEALHFDAHILEIKKKQHDMRGCRCNFFIKYLHDETVERVFLGRLCRRPKY